MIKIIPKKKEVRFCKGLTSREFRCKCNTDSCRATIITKPLIKAFEKFRNLVNVPLIINSGFRCTLHNRLEGGRPCSRHLTGEAVDISKKTLNHLSDQDIEFALKESGFTFVKIYKSFVHADVRERN